MMQSRLLPYCWYPSILIAAATGFGIMLSADLPLALATYGPITLAATAILILELRFPERAEWRPRWPEVKTDAAFMIVVQIMLPRLLVATGILTLSGLAHQHVPNKWWPHEWLLIIQILGMVLLVDLMRYWLHRACHHFMPLWRLHEVHHSPDILYTVNVGRFHPVEKILHFVLDTVPFVVIGVKPEVIAGYFLLYSVNGFFQHSNLQLKYGWLNYLVGSAETHRWHHSTDPKIASCNFGNTTIVWDLLFGTWYLPPGRSVGDVGILNKSYPKGFWAQMREPFQRSRKSRPSADTSRWTDALIKLRLNLTLLTHSRRIALAAQDPMRVQNALLRNLLKTNQNTIFGQGHGFHQIEHYDDFIRRVPVSDYEALRPFIDRQIETDEKALTEELPIQYVRTSGTTGKAKDIPLTRSHLRALRRIQQTAVAFQYRNSREAFAGAILAIVSPPREGQLSNGKFFGSSSGIVAADTPTSVLSKFVIPPQVLTISDSRLKYLLILRLAIARSDITYAGTANATTMLALIRLYRENKSALINDVRHGTFFLAGQLPEDVLSAVRQRLRALPQRAEALARMSTLEPARIADLWPSLKMLVSWTCASAGTSINALRKELPGQTRILELGYLSSEFRGTITLGKRAGSGFPTLDTHFFEFVERDKWDSGEPEFLTLDRIRKGFDYYIIVTTPSGLYRYFINDLVRVTGYFQRTPLLKFLQKGKGVTNITGEKLYESQVLTTVNNALGELGLASRFVMMLADEDLPGYRLYLEVDNGGRPDTRHFTQKIDDMLGMLNIEYRAKRESGRLGPLRTLWLQAGAADAFKEFCLTQGQREGQFKTVALSYRSKFAFDLDVFADGDQT